MQSSLYQTRATLRLSSGLQVELLKQATFSKRIHGRHKKHDGHWIIPLQSNVCLETERTTPPFFGSDAGVAITNLQGLWCGIQSIQKSTHHFWNITHCDDLWTWAKMYVINWKNVFFHFPVMISIGFCLHEEDVFSSCENKPEGF